MMNLQRREEIRVIAECPNDRHWAQEMRRTVAELLTHIDTLEQTAAERVIADGSRGPTPDYTGEGSAWVPPVEARAVVVPEPTSDEWRAIAENARSADMVDFLAGAAAYGLWLREHSRAIPADRVLGDGMAAVKWISVNDALPEDGQTVGFVTECANDKWYHGRVLGGRYMAGEFGGFSVPGLMVQASHWFAFPPLPDVLRANQGGAAA